MTRGFSLRAKDAVKRARRRDAHARLIVQRLMIDRLTYDGDDDVGMRVWESGRIAWYSVDETSVRAILWNFYRYEPRSDAAVRTAVRFIIERAKAEAQSKLPVRKVAS